MPNIIKEKCYEHEETPNKPTISCLDLYTRGYFNIINGKTTSDSFAIPLQIYSRNLLDLTSHPAGSRVIVDGEFISNANLYSFHTPCEAFLNKISLLLRISPTNQSIDNSSKLYFKLYLSRACTKIWDVIPSFKHPIDIPPMGGPYISQIIVPISTSLPKYLYIHPCDRVLLTFYLVFDGPPTRAPSYDMGISGQLYYTCINEYNEKKTTNMS